MSRLRIALLVSLGALVSGCHAFTIKNGDAAKEMTPAPTYDERRNSAIVGDIVTIDKPGRLDLVCPQGWAHIDREQTFLDGFLSAIGGWFYKADTVTLYCKKGGVAATPATPLPASAPPAPAAAPPAPPAAAPAAPPPAVAPAPAPVPVLPAPAVPSPTLPDPSGRGGTNGGGG